MKSALRKVACRSAGSAQVSLRNALHVASSA